MAISGLGDAFLNVTVKAQATEAKVNKYDCIKLKNFRTVKVKKNQQNVKATYGLVENI